MGDNSTTTTYGLLVPEWYVFHPIDPISKDLSSIFLGFLLATTIFSANKAWQQSSRMFKRYRQIKLYMVMIWGEIGANLAMAFVVWTYQRDKIATGFWVFFAIAFVWVFQIQFLLHIIINRLGLLMTSRRQCKRLSILVGVFIGLVNISVFIIWIPAQLQISQTWIDTNLVWDRIEKSLICLVDMALNLYFVYLTRTRLIANGLTKYWPLYNVNLFLIVISVALDVVLIGVMFGPSPLLYAQFQPVAYMCKLHIEMHMADLLVRVARASSNEDYDWKSTTSHDDGSGSTSKPNASTQVGNTTLTANGTTHQSKLSKFGSKLACSVGATGHQKRNSVSTGGGGGGRSRGFNNSVHQHHHQGTGTNTIIEAVGAEEMELQENMGARGGDIVVQRTVETTVVVEDDGDASSTSSSTRELRRHYGVDVHDTFGKK